MFIFKYCKITKTNDNRRNFNLNRESPLYQLLVSILIILGVGGVLPIISMGVKTIQALSFSSMRFLSLSSPVKIYKPIFFTQIFSDFFRK